MSKKPKLYDVKKVYGFLFELSYKILPIITSLGLVYFLFSFLVNENLNEGPLLVGNDYEYLLLLIFYIVFLGDYFCTLPLSA
jgi:hypothetical protein